jgi:hypothetical protein
LSDSQSVRGTELLLISRALRRARAEHYVEWAVQQLCEGRDSPSLRILAGLSTRFERDDIEPYFLRTCDELQIPTPVGIEQPLVVAIQIRHAYESGFLSAAEAIHFTSDLHRLNEYSNPLLHPWMCMSEELDYRDGYLYPPEVLASLDDAVKREWLLMERAAALPLPDGWLRMSRCKKCSRVGPLALKRPTVLSRARQVLTRSKPPMEAVCTSCGSSACESLADPGVRSAYFDQVENAGPRQGTDERSNSGLNLTG